MYTKAEIFASTAGHESVTMEGWRLPYIPKTFPKELDIFLVLSHQLQNKFLQQAEKLMV